MPLAPVIHLVDVPANPSLVEPNVTSVKGATLENLVMIANLATTKPLMEPVLVRKNYPVFKQKYTYTQVAVPTKYYSFQRDIATELVLLKEPQKESVFAR